MPTSWYSWHGIDKDSLNEKFSLYKEIVAEKKPYFMVYIYPSLRRQYNTYVKESNQNAYMHFRMTMNELESAPVSSLDDDKLNFVSMYRRHIPVGTNKCVMNTICRRIESEFDGYLSKKNKEIPFDYSILKCDSDYSTAHYNAIRRVMDDYNKRLVEYSSSVDAGRYACGEDTFSNFVDVNRWFREECACVCPDYNELCNIVLDLCYTRASTKRFAWKMCGVMIIQNLLQKNDNLISYPHQDDDGDVVWKSKRYAVTQTTVRCEYDNFE